MYPFLLTLLSFFLCFTETSFINVEHLPSFEELSRDCILVLDFFTYCCINCLHILPCLHELELKSRNRKVQVIGIHSAKFSNEKILSNVQNAVDRYKITHPVLVDDGQLWDEMDISCWPTVLIVGPGRRVIFSLVGENNVNKWLHKLTDAAANYFSLGTKLIIDLPPQVSENKTRSTDLSFPSKVSLSLDGTNLAISDTGNNRVLIVDLEGNILNVIGGLKDGFLDGGFEDVKFNAPQGTAWISPSKLYVADSGNHAIRLIDLKAKQVSTAVGNGLQGSDLVGGARGRLQSLNSPWDLCFADDKLFIAMAGSHQVWLLVLNDGTTVFNRKTYSEGTCLAFAGSGAEENRNNLYAHKAAFAQPSGLAFLAREESLVVADSESSTVRLINVRTGATKALVGGDKDPSNLFAYGDQDGIGFQVKLQHPLGVAINEKDHSILVLDSYNHKVWTVLHLIHFAALVTAYSFRLRKLTFKARNASQFAAPERRITETIVVVFMRYLMSPVASA